MANNKLRALRVLKILELTDANSPMNASQIMERLRLDYDIDKVSRDTIYDDISALIEADYPIEQCEDASRGWYFKNRTFEDWQIKMLYDSISQAVCVSENESAQICENLLALMSDRGRKKLSHLMKPKSNNAAVEKAIGSTIDILLEAMYVGRKIEFQYTEVMDDLSVAIKRDGHIYELNLYMIYWADNTYFLIGAHDHHRELTTYRLERITNLRLSEQRMVPAIEKIGPNPEQQIQEQIQKSVYNYSGEPVRIVIEYKPDAITNRILKDFTDGEVKVQLQKDGTCHARFTKMDSPTLIGWFVSNADRFKVIKPEKIQNQVIERIQEAVKRYE